MELERKEKFPDSRKQYLIPTPKSFVRILSPHSTYTSTINNSVMGGVTRKVQIGENGDTRINIPSDFAKLLDLEQSDKVEFMVKDSETLQISKKG